MGHGHAHHHHDHHHDHAHPHDDRSRSRSALGWALAFNAAFLVVEASAGWWFDSLALLSDAAHMVSDVAALGLALIAAQLATRPASPGRTFGLLRAEILGAFINAVLLVVACIFIFKEAVSRLVSEPPPIPGVAVLVVASMGLFVNLGSAWFLYRSGSANLNVRGALVHMLADALGSGGAMIAAGLVIAFGWNAADAVVSFFIGALVLWGTWDILRDSTAVLLEFAPKSVKEEELSRALVAIEGVAEVHELHVWTVASGQVNVTAHLVLCEGADPTELLQRAQAVIRNDFGVHHSTVQIDAPEHGPCPQRECPMLVATEPALAPVH